MFSSIKSNNQRRSTVGISVVSLLLLLALQSTVALEKTWSLYHSLNGGQAFSRRATVKLSVGNEEGGSNEVELVVNNDNSTLNDETFMAAKQPGAMYQLKLVEGDDLSSNFLLTSVPACHLLRASFREEILLTLGPHASAISLSYIPLISPLAPKNCDHEHWEQKRSNLPEGWETKISWETSTPGMKLAKVMPNYKPPPGLKWLPRVGPNGKIHQGQGPPGSDQGGGGPGQEQEMSGPFGFMKRYWYIILPLLIANLFGGEAPAPEGQPAQSGPAAGAGAGSASAPAAAPSGGSPPKSKRGKRG